MTPYRLIEHTADLGMEFSGSTLEAVFIAAGEGLFDVITDRECLRCDLTVEIEVDGSDHEDLMINWLRELLYYHQVKRMLFKTFEVEMAGDYSLMARVSGEKFDPLRHTIKTEIKAATYHDLKVEKRPKGWVARVIFDV